MAWSALPDRQHRQLARDAARERLQRGRAVRLGRLPAELTADELSEAGVLALDAPAEATPPSAEAEGEGQFSLADCAAVVPPWSAAHPYVNLYGPRAAEKFVTATVAGNVRVTQVGRDYDTHHIVLDFGAMPFPVLEGESIGIPPGADGGGRPHHRGNIRSRARATASVPATTTSR